MPARKHRSQGPSLLPFVSILIIAGAAVGVAFLIQKDKTEVQATPANSDDEPFSNYPPETPEPRPSGDGAPSRIAPSGLMAEPTWGRALELADRGWELTEAAEAAREKGDHADFQENGKAAKAAFNEALEITAEWEAQLLDTYGESDSQVSEIKRIRSKWFDKIRYFHKTTGR